MYFQIFFLILLSHRALQIEVNDTLLAEESSFGGNYVPEQQYSYGLSFDNVPSFQIYKSEYKIPGYSYATPFADVTLSKSAKLVSAPITENLLFNSGNRYSSGNRDYKDIYSRYLRNDIYLSDCYYRQNSISQNFDGNDLEEAFQYANYAVRGYESIVTQHRHSRRRPKEHIHGAVYAKFLRLTTQYLLNKKCISKYDAAVTLPQINIRPLLVKNMGICGDAPPECDPYTKYQTYDGSCNNLQNPTLGKSFTCHKRLLPPDYSDGVEAHRLAYDSTPLPEARIISTRLLPAVPIPDHKLTALTMVYGQFAAHDITRTLEYAPDDDVQCCGRDKDHPECIPITPLPPGDVLTQIFNQTCITLIRTLPCNPCTLGPRENINRASQVFDLSQIYDVSQNASVKLRRHSRGKLKSRMDGFNKELPMARADQENCNVPYHKTPNIACMESGDSLRASQHPPLQTMHAIFHRRHNQHAGALSRVNPHWTDEMIFQEARRILIAEFQKIMYGEYIPAVMGKSLTEHFNIGIADHGYTNYNPGVAQVTLHEFVSGAGRFGHSQINDLFRVLMGQHSYSFSLKDTFFEPTQVSLGHTTGIIKGLLIDPSSSVDPFISSDVSNFLYKSRVENFGRDLPAYNIIRSREHGLPGYVHYLDYCFGYRVNSWDDLLAFIPKDYVASLRQYYKHWNDIDMFVGGLFEKKMEDAAMGPTFGCINGIQYFHLKFGDRFYFEHGKQSGSFTLSQLDNIRHVSSFAKIICRTAEVGEIQPKAFLLPSERNPMRPCESYPEIDYNLWAEKYG